MILIIAMIKMMLKTKIIKNIKKYEKHGVYVNDHF